GALFIAGIVPGLLGVLCYATVVFGVTQFRPELGPPGERMPWLDRLRALRGVAGMLTLFLLVIGGIYFGIFTPSEAAGIGASGAFLIALARRTLSWRTLWDVLVETARTSTAMFAVLIGAVLFSNFINVARMPNIVGDWITSSGFEPMLVVLVILAIYLLLGCVFESFSMVLLTVPIFYPIVAQLGFDLIWFGIIVVVVTEISLITPPIGLNVFVLQATARDVPLVTIFRGVMPFIAADAVRLAILVLFPGIVLFLPRLM